jgi:thioredoxin 1
MGDTMKSVSDESFETDVLKSTTPVLVDFWAEWCGPCRAIAPVLEELSVEYSGRVVVTKLNIDQNPASPEKYGVRGIPTMLLFKNGMRSASQIGPASKSDLKVWLDKNL